MAAHARLIGRLTFVPDQEHTHREMAEQMNMLTEDGCRSRRERLWAELPETTEWVLIADPRHVNYLCGFWIDPVSSSYGERGFLFLERTGETILLCDNFARSAAIGNPFADQVITESWYDHKHAVGNRDHALFEALGRISSRMRSRPGVLEAEWLPVGALDRIGYEPAGQEVSLGSLLRSLRRKKDPDEMAILKACIRAGEAGHRRAREVVGPGVREVEVYREVQTAALAEVGSQALVYGDFRATSSARPTAGGPATGYLLHEGDIFILDYSVVLAGYRGDFTNSLAVGTATRAQQDLLEACRAALIAGERALVPGSSGADVFRAVDRPMAAAGWPLSYHAGHGIGMGHPEAPAFVPESDEVIEAGDVVTLEPGAYVAGVGGLRIEKNYLLTDTGCECLTHHEIAL